MFKLTSCPLVPGGPDLPGEPASPGGPLTVWILDAPGPFES